ncbi:MAG: hypothetical protein HYW91_02810, partial [Candidatus Sungbacteria bacterium]|nr:hypothetical protein [Candidatus Sungbacteria bacterium]
MLSDNEKFISLAEAAQGTPYSQEYLSLLARKGKLPAKKVGRNWYATKLAVANYLDEQKIKLLELAAQRSGASLALPEREEKSAISDIKPHIVSDMPRNLTSPVTAEIDARSRRRFILEEVHEDQDWEAVPFLYRIFSSPTLRIFFYIIGHSFLAGTILSGFFVLGVFGMNLVNEKSLEFAQQKSQRDLQYFAAVAGERIGILEFTQNRLRIFAGALRDTGEMVANAILELTGSPINTLQPLLSVPSSPSPAIVEEPVAEEVDVGRKAPSVEEPREAVLKSDFGRKEVGLQEVREIIIPADFAAAKADILLNVEKTNKSIRERFDKAIDDLTFKLSRTSSRAESSIQMVTLSQKIDQLDGATLKNVTFSGASGLTDNDIPNNITVIGSQSFSGLTLSGDFTTSGDLTFSSSATTTIPASAVNAFSIATSSTAVPFMTFDTSNYRVGIGTSTPGTTFSVGGNALISGTLDVGGVFRANSSSLTVNNIPSTAHSFSTWAVNSEAANATTSSLIINPSSAGTDTNLFGLMVADNVKFLVDAEGDTFVNSLTSAGSVTVASTSASSLLIEGSTYVGDAITDLFSVNSGNIFFNNRATSTIIDNTINAFSLATSSTGIPLFSLDTAQGGRVGIGTTSPWGIFSLNPTALIGTGPQLVVGSSSATSFLISNAGNVGIGTTSPGTLLSIGGSVFLGASAGGGTVGGLGVGRATTTQGVLETTGAGSIGGALSVSGITNLATGNTYQIAGTDVLSNNTLGSGVLTSSLTSVGALSSGSLAAGFGSIMINSASSTITNLSSLFSTSTQATSTYLA